MDIKITQEINYKKKKSKIYCKFIFININVINNIIIIKRNGYETIKS